MELLNLNDAVNSVVPSLAAWSSLVRPTEASRRGEERGAGRPRGTLSPIGLPWPPKFSIPTNASVVSRVTSVDEDGGSLLMKGLLRHHERSSSPLKFPGPNMQQLFTPSRRTWLL
jgi:hypothetical protein